MKTISLESRSFLKERTLKFCIVMVFIPIWLLVLAVYYSKGHNAMPQLQRSILQFLIFTNTLTLSLFLAAATLQVISIKRNITTICSSVVAELSALSFIVCFQLVASIALSAGTPSFPCPLEGSCQGNAFFAVVAWIAPLLFAIHSIEFAVRSRRLAALNPKVWSTATWLVQWDGGEALNPKDLERGISISGPKALVLPQTKEVKADLEAPAPIYEANRSRRASHQFKVGGLKASNGNRLSKLPPPPPVPKTPGTEHAQYLVINPTKVQYVVPRLTAPPKYFVQIPENISYTVPKIGKPPCPKTRAKERRKARKDQQKRQTKIEKGQESGLKWSFHF